ncbi:hypothetical protein C8R43DRAFT_1027962 [Mycena crocata]|nr:hypothetical protein C8R43DRAFT_1027962 [Mycena crocata]
MKLSGPADLDTLRSVCSVFKTILDANPSIWKYARAPLKIPAPPVGRLGNGVSGGALELLQRGDSERNYIMYLFGGGKCTVCGNWTAQLPCSFALGFRCCSKQCRHRVFSLKTQLGLVAIKTGELDRHPGIQWLTPHPAPLGGLYFRADLLAVKQKIQALGRISKTSDEFNFTNATATYWAESRCQTFTLLDCWHVEYTKSVASTRAKNLAILRGIARQEKVTLQTLLDSPTLHRIVTAFNRDVTKLGINDWRMIRTAVCQELKGKTGRK